MIPFLIKLYWKLIPENKRRNCLFKESCSNHIMKIHNEKGSIAAIKAFYVRFKQCRPGYEIILSTSGELEGLKLCDGSYLDKENVTKNVDLL